MGKAADFGKVQADAQEYANKHSVTPADLLQTTILYCNDVMKSAHRDLLAGVMVSKKDVRYTVVDHLSAEAAKVLASKVRSGRDEVVNEWLEYKNKKGVVDGEVS